MWIVIAYGDSKKIAFEIRGDESLGDIKRVLHYVYHFPRKLQISFNNRPLPDVPGPLLDIEEIKNRTQEQKELIELKVPLDLKDEQFRGPEGPIHQSSDISVGRYFKKDDKRSPSSINSSRSRSSSRSASAKIGLKA